MEKKLIRTPVPSRDIAIVGYDPENLILEITFRGGGVYQYAGVMESIYNNLMNAPSLGTYFNKNIKDSYQATKIA